MKTLIKKAEEAISNKDKDAVEKVKIALKQIDKTQSKGIIHKNLASRKKSKLAILFNKNK